MSSGEWRLIKGWSQARNHEPSTKFFAPSQLRQMRGCEQVAAVCYRMRGARIEFLLVQTRGGRWTFPKGGAEPGLTHAQAAALEAFEEAGVHGRMEEASFTRYVRRKWTSPGPTTPEVAFNAHLCEVLWLGPPQESGRNPTWFTADKAKRRLRQDRTPDYGAELAQVVDRAIMRVHRLRSGNQGPDALQKAQFAVENARVHTGREKASGASKRGR